MEKVPDWSKKNPYKETVPPHRIFKIMEKWRPIIQSAFIINRLLTPQVFKVGKKTVVLDDEKTGNVIARIEGEEDDKKINSSYRKPDGKQEDKEKEEEQEEKKQKKIGWDRQRGVYGGWHGSRYGEYDDYGYSYYDW